MSNTAIKVTNLSKRYRIGLKEELHDSLTGQITAFLKSPIDNFRRLKKLSEFGNNGEQADVIWALKDVSFEVKQGEVLGVIGANGAGKSTLLKVLSQITEPTSGTAEINGRIASLLEVGTGFHSELTGRENIYLNGTILGMTKREIDKRFDEIVDFSGIGKFLYTPVKRYSSGMTVRLAFSVAAFLEPEILLIDEVLAVGDIEFQNRCIGKMGQISKSGRTVIFVSHQLQAVEKLCDKAIILDKGKILDIGNTSKMIKQYISTQMKKSKKPILHRKDRSGDGLIKVLDTWIENNDYQNISKIQIGELISIIIKYDVQGSIETHKDFYIGCSIKDQKGNILTDLNNRNSGFNHSNTLKNRGLIKCTIPKFQFNIGLYSYSIFIMSNGVVRDWVIDALTFEVIEGDYFKSGKIGKGLFFIEQKWTY